MRSNNGYTTRVSPRFNSGNSSHLPGTAVQKHRDLRLIYATPYPDNKSTNKISTCITNHNELLHAPGPVYFQRSSLVTPILSSNRPTNSFKPSCMGLTSQNFFSSPVSSFEGRACYAPIASHEIYTDKTIRKVREQKVMFATQRGFKFPKECIKPTVMPLIRPKQTRPNTGKVFNGGKKESIVLCPGTAFQGKKGPLFQSTVPTKKPQTVPERRPESRYNKATLFAKLENGRSQSPEYQVPILHMNLMESHEQHVLLPGCWNKDMYRK